MTAKGRVIGLLGAVVVLGSACGSSATLGTGGGSASTVSGALVAHAQCSGAVEAAGMTTTTPAPTATQALHGYLAGAPAATAWRTATFELAQPPPAFAPPIGVTSQGTFRPSNTEPGPTAPAPHMVWFAHRGDDGRVTAAIGTTDVGEGWIVSTFQHCSPETPPDGATATTIQTAGNGPGSTSIIAVGPAVPPATMPAATPSTTVVSATVTPPSVMGGP